RRAAEGLDQLPGALVALATLADAAVNDLLELVAAGELRDLGGWDPSGPVPLDEHPEELSDLIDVVARLPLGDEPRGDLARRHVGVEGAGGGAAPATAQR